MLRLSHILGFIILITSCSYDKFLRHILQFFFSSLVLFVSLSFQYYSQCPVPQQPQFCVLPLMWESVKWDEACCQRTPIYITLDVELQRRDTHLHRWFCTFYKTSGESAGKEDCAHLSTCICTLCCREWMGIASIACTCSWCYMRGRNCNTVSFVITRVPLTWIGYKATDE